MPGNGLAYLKDLTTAELLNQPVLNILLSMAWLGHLQTESAKQLQDPRSFTGEESPSLLLQIAYLADLGEPVPCFDTGYLVWACSIILMGSQEGKCATEHHQVTWLQAELAS